MRKKRGPYVIKGKTECTNPGFISKPEQGKKTVEMAKIIGNDLQHHKHILNIYITMNRKNHADKSHEAFLEFEKYFRDNNHDIDVLHGDKQTFKDPDGYIFRAENGRRLIIGILNKSRLTVLYDVIIKWVNIKTINRVKIYLDEAAVTITQFINYIWSKLDYNINNVDLTLIDAHCGSILTNPKFKKFFNGLKKIDNEYNLENYMFMRSLPFINKEWTDNEDILEDYLCGNLNILPGDYILWPFPWMKLDQYELSQEITNTIPNIVLLLINGDGYHIFQSGGLKTTYPKKKCGKTQYCGWCRKCKPELKEELDYVKLFKKMYSNRGFILGGHDCINRAMTYHTADMPFTKAFICNDSVMNRGHWHTNKSYTNSAIKKKETVSQMIKRMCGSFKEKLENNNTPLPIFYGPGDIYEGICELEKISEAIANKSGYIDLQTRIDMDYMDDFDLSTSKLKMIEEIIDPYDYYFKEFKIPSRNHVYIKQILQDFRQKIGGNNVNISTIKNRLEGNNDNTYYTEDIYHTKLTKDLFINDIKILRSAIDDNTTSRVRIIYDNEDNISWIIHFQNKRNEFIWNNIKYSIIDIEGDGNCLFNCFIKENITTHSVKKLRRIVSNYLVEHKPETYDYLSDDEWEDWCEEIRTDGVFDIDIFDIVPFALSEILDINITIYGFNTCSNGGKEVGFDKPLIIPEDRSKHKEIHLYKTHNHYNLLKMIL